MRSSAVKQSPYEHGFGAAFMDAAYARLCGEAMRAFGVPFSSATSCTMNRTGWSRSTMDVPSRCSGSDGMKAVSSSIPSV